MLIGYLVTSRAAPAPNSLGRKSVWESLEEVRETGSRSAAAETVSQLLVYVFVLYFLLF